MSYEKCYEIGNRKIFLLPEPNATWYTSHVNHQTSSFILEKGLEIARNLFDVNGFKLNTEKTSTITYLLRLFKSYKTLYVLDVYFDRPFKYLFEKAFEKAF